MQIQRPERASPSNGRTTVSSPVTASRKRSRLWRWWKISHQDHTRRALSLKHVLCRATKSCEQLILASFRMAHPVGFVKPSAACHLGGAQRAAVRLSAPPLLVDCAESPDDSQMDHDEYGSQAPAPPGTHEEVAQHVGCADTTDSVSLVSDRTGTATLSSWCWNTMAVTNRQLTQPQPFDCTTRGNWPMFAFSGHFGPTPDFFLEGSWRKLSWLSEDRALEPAFPARECPHQQI